MKKKFVNGNNEVFTVSEVLDVAGSLVVHYTKDDTGEKYSCLLEAFADRFREVQNND